MFAKKALAFVLCATLAVSNSIAQNDKGPNQNRFIVSGNAGDGAKNKVLEDETKRNNGNIVMKLGKGKNSLTVVELPANANPNAFKRSLNNEGFKLEVDTPIYPVPTDEDEAVNRARSLRGDRRLAESIPWGIKRVFSTGDNWNSGGEYSIPTMPSTPTTHKICIVDSGYYKAHEDLPDTASTADTVLNDPTDFTDGCAHGSHVAGTILATANNDKGVIGVFPDATPVFFVKVFGDATSTSCGYTYESSVLYANQKCVEAGAKVINMSLGGGGFSSSTNTGYDNLVNDGALIIAAAGNGGNSAYSYPASYPAVMSVAATDVNNNKASFSQFNDQVDIAAPGVGVLSTTTASTSSYSTYSGTSMATPHVAGVALLLWNKYPQCTNVEIREALEKSAIDYGATGLDNEFGNGIVNYNNAAAYVTSANGCVAYASPTVSPAPSAATNAPTECVGDDLTVQVTTDNYPGETSWTLKNECTGDVVWTKSGYTSTNTLYTDKRCQRNGEYTFTINDSFGDGICCGYGSGSYTVTWGNAVVASGGEFTTSESTTFGSCSGPPLTPPPTPSPSSSPSSAPTTPPPTTSPTTAEPTPSPSSSPSSSPTTAEPSPSPTTPAPIPTVDCGSITDKNSCNAENLCTWVGNPRSGSCQSDSPSAPSPEPPAPTPTTCPVCGNGDTCCPSDGVCESSGKPERRRCVF